MLPVCTGIWAPKLYFITECFHHQLSNPVFKHIALYQQSYSGLAKTHACD